jgi:PAS domain S-box-containing protein
MSAQNKPSITPEDDATAVASMRDEQRIFRAIADNAFYGNVFIDSEGIFRYVNRSFASMHGYQPEELIGQHFSRVHTPDQLEGSRRIIEASVQHGVSEPQEHWYLHRDGTVFPLLVACASIRSETGTETYTALSAVDLSPMHRAEMAYQTLFSEMLDGFAHHQIICDDSGIPVDYRFLAVNPAFERITGLKAAQLIGHTISDVLPGTESYWIDTYGKVALSGEPARFENYSSVLDRHFEVTAFRPAPGEFACIFQDVTARKRSEEALRQSERALRETQRLAHVGSWTWDFAKDEVKWTEVLFEVFGLKATDVAPTFTEQEALVTASSYRALSEAVTTTKETGAPYEVELEIPRDDGTTRWLWARGEPVVAYDGRRTGLWGAAQDVTDRKLHEIEKLHLEAQLARAQRLESVGRLAGGIAHDFNNMLTVILGRVDQALGGVDPRDPHDPHDPRDPRDPQRAGLEEIRLAAERAADLTRQLLAFSRNQPSSPRVVDLNATVAGVVTMLRRLIGEDITLEWKPGENLSSVLIDPSQVDRILANLCVNARDAIEGTGTITIETANVCFDEQFCAEHPDFRVGRYVELTVSDDGSGMDPETQTHLFEPFFTTKESGQGTGLGLSTTYGVVTQNEGFLRVSSEPGVGTSLSIYLPQNGAEPVARSGELPVKVPESGHGTILLVEDEPGILAMVTTMLEGQGYTVLAASAPSEAIRLAEDRPGAINLLLTDVILPEMHGQALADRLRSSQPNLMCLYMSGYTANVIASTGEDDVGSHFISKPFRLGDLATKVREAIGS